MSKNGKEIKKEIPEERRNPKEETSKGSSSVPTRIYNTRSKMKTKKITGVIEISSDSERSSKSSSDSETESEHQFWTQLENQLPWAIPVPRPEDSDPVIESNPGTGEDYSEPTSEVDSE